MLCVTDTAEELLLCLPAVCGLCVTDVTTGELLLFVDCATDVTTVKLLQFVNSVWQITHQVSYSRFFCPLVLQCVDCVLQLTLPVSHCSLLALCVAGNSAIYCSLCGLCMTHTIGELLFHLPAVCTLYVAASYCSLAFLQLIACEWHVTRQVGYSPIFRNCAVEMLWLVLNDLCAL